jgi:molybdopterin converting factor small subunit
MLGDSTAWRAASAVAGRHFNAALSDLTRSVPNGDMQIKLRCGGETELIGFPDSRPPTVTQVIDAIGRRRPELTAGWRDEDGRLRGSLPVFINGENIRYRDGLDTLLKDGDELTVIPLIAGG